MTSVALWDGESCALRVLFLLGRCGVYVFGFAFAFGLVAMVAGGGRRGTWIHGDCAGSTCRCRCGSNGGGREEKLRRWTTLCSAWTHRRI